MTPPPLFRAIAYRLERAGTPFAQSWPEVTVFFEAPTAAAAPAQLLRLLAQAWHVQPADLDFYNLWDEAELQRNADCGQADGGEAWLLQTGNADGGPLFCGPDRTLLLVCPPTLHRLSAARCVARQLQQRRLALRRPAAPHNVAQRAAYEAGCAASMGAHC